MYYFSQLHEQLLQLKLKFKNKNGIQPVKGYSCDPQE